MRPDILSPSGEASANDAPAEAVYRRRQTASRELRETLDTRSRRLSGLRFLVFASGLGCLLGALLTAASRGPGWFVGAGLCFGLFALLVPAHDRLLRRLRLARTLEEINQEALHRLARRFDGLPAAGARGADPSRSRVKDLQLFGEASLFRLISTAATPLGRSTLARWLLEPAPAEEIPLRQAAVRELAGDLDLRQDLQAHARLLGEADADPEPFLSWAEGEPWLGRRRVLRWSARALTLLSLTTFVGYVAGRLPIHLWLLTLVANFAFSFWAGRRIQALFASIASREGKFSLYPGLFDLLESASFDSPMAAECRSSLADDELSAGGETRRLHRLIELSHLRYSSLHGVVQAITLWDFHLLARIEAWQARCGGRVRPWFEALGRIEALASLAVLAHDHPDWSFPEVDPEAPALEARALGHPSLPEGVRVDNDVVLGPSGTFLLLTGSNMSGKSTLLRAIGTNVVLAQAGGPVCAASLRMPPLELGTSILIEDSLTDGISFFMAELQRLKVIVERARTPGRSRRLLYLMDEILRGTNSAERRIAVRKVLQQLLAADALGAISTHDLELAEVRELASACRPMHFRETLHDAGESQIMTFDYKLRPGVATTANALRLLRLVGLDENP